MVFHVSRYRAYRLHGLHSNHYYPRVLGKLGLRLSCLKTRKPPRCSHRMWSRRAQQVTQSRCLGFFSLEAPGGVDPSCPCRDRACKGPEEHVQ